MEKESLAKRVKEFVVGEVETTTSHISELKRRFKKYGLGNAFKYELAMNAFRHPRLFGIVENIEESASGLLLGEDTHVYIEAELQEAREGFVGSFYGLDEINRNARKLHPEAFKYKQ